MLVCFSHHSNQSSSYHNHTNNTICLQRDQPNPLFQDLILSLSSVQDNHHHSQGTRSIQWSHISCFFSPYHHITLYLTVPFLVHMSLTFSTTYYFYQAIRVVLFLPTFCCTCVFLILSLTVSSSLILQITLFILCPLFLSFPKHTKKFLIFCCSHSLSCLFFFYLSNWLANLSFAVCTACINVCSPNGISTTSKRGFDTRLTTALASVSKMILSSIAF